MDNWTQIRVMRAQGCRLEGSRLLLVVPKRLLNVRQLLVSHRRKENVLKSAARSPVLSHKYVRSYVTVAATRGSMSWS